MAGSSKKRAVDDEGKPEPITIKKYANRRLYNTATSSYVTLDTLAKMVKEGEEFLVFDAKTGDDITRSVLTQIIFEEEAKGENLLPVNFLRQLIGFYGHGMQTFVPSYLEMSLETLGRNQAEIGRAFGGEAAANAMKTMTERNAEMFRNAMKVFTPFVPGGAAEAPQAQSAPDATQRDGELSELRTQMEQMRKALEKMERKE